MKRWLAVLAFAGLLGSPGRLFADDVPQLEFLRELRGRYPELAEEYVNKLRQSNPPPEVAAILPLELAKILLDKASAEESGSTKLDLYNKARAGFEEFIAKNPNSPLIGDARLEVARVTVLQGKTQLSRALMQEEKRSARKRPWPRGRSFSKPRPSSPLPRTCSTSRSTRWASPRRPRNAPPSGRWSRPGSRPTWTWA